MFTLNWISDPKNGVKVQRNVNWIKEAKKVDQYTVDLHMKKPFPQAFEFLSGPLTIYPNEYYAKVGQDGMHKQPVGTGPMKVVSVKTAEEYVFARNDATTGVARKAPRKPKSSRSVKSQTFRLRSLNYSQAGLIGPLTSLQTTLTRSVACQALAPCKLAQCGLDTWASIRQRQLRTYNQAQGSPAMAMAINREALVKNLIRGDARVIHTPCYPTQFGCDSNAAVKWEFNPGKAKQLLAEAGYPNGFEIDFYTFRPADWAEAIMGDLAKVGIKAKLTKMPYFSLRDSSTTKNHSHVLDGLGLLFHERHVGHHQSLLQEGT